MKQTLYKKFPALFLCAALLTATLCGCQAKQSDDVSLYSLPLNAASIDYLESAVFGMSPDDIIEELSFSEEEYEEMIPPGVIVTDKPITAAGKEFTKVTKTVNGRRIFTNIFTYSGVREEAQCSGVVYRCECESAEELAEVAEASYLAAVEMYGPDEQGHLSNGKPLCEEGVFDKIRKVKDGQSRKWAEAWCVGEYSYLEIVVWADEVRGLDVEWSYFVLPEEWQHYHPGAGTPHTVSGHPISFRDSILWDHLPPDQRVGEPLS